MRIIRVHPTGWSRPGTALSGVGPVSGSDATAGSLPEGWGTDSTGPGPGTAGAYTSHLLSDQLLNDHPLVLEYLAKHVLAKGTAAVQVRTDVTATGAAAHSS
jgi:hypothetical protein